jgi:hypothetical protein
MNVTIKLRDEQVAALQAQAEAHGLTVERWLQQLAEQQVPADSIAHLQRTNPAEWARQFSVWAEGHDRSTRLCSLTMM